MVCASYLCSVPRLQIHSILRKATLIFWWSLSLPPPAEHAEQFFGLMEGLQTLFGLPVDLVESASIRTPYFRVAVDKNRTPLYDAA